MKKRIGALLLTLAMVAAYMPMLAVTSFAAQSVKVKVFATDGNEQIGDVVLTLDESAGLKTNSNIDNINGKMKDASLPENYTRDGEDFYKTEKLGALPHNNHIDGLTFSDGYYIAWIKVKADSTDPTFTVDVKGQGTITVKADGEPVEGKSAKIAKGTPVEVTFEPKAGDLYDFVLEHVTESELDGDVLTFNMPENDVNLSVEFFTPNFVVDENEFLCSEEKVEATFTLGQKLPGNGKQYRLFALVGDEEVQVSDEEFAKDTKIPGETKGSLTVDVTEYFMENGKYADGKSVEFIAKRIQGSEKVSTPVTITLKHDEDVVLEAVRKDPKDADYHTLVCPNCDFAMDEAHDWGKGVVVREATSTEKGVMRYTCTKCGEIKDVEFSADVKTGDSDNMALWMMLAVAAMVVAGYAVSRKEN